jgi:hypothetical protein
VTPHLPGTAHPCPSRSAHAHSSAFPAMSLPLHRHVSAARHASSPCSHAPVRYASARTTLTCALSPYAALALLGHLCSCASPRPYTHTQALRLLHIRPCLMTNALSRRLRPVTALGLFSSHLSCARRVLPFSSKKLSLSLLSSFRNSHLHHLSSPASVDSCSCPPVACTVHATPPHPLGFRAVWPCAFSPHPHVSRRYRTSPLACVHYRPCPSRSAPMRPPISLVALDSLLSARLPAACLRNAPLAWLLCPCAPGCMPHTLMFSSACATLPGFRACHLHVPPLARTLRPFISSVTRLFTRHPLSPHLQVPLWATQALMAGRYSFYKCCCRFPLLRASCLPLKPERIALLRLYSSHRLCLAPSLHK